MKRLIILILFVITNLYGNSNPIITNITPLSPVTIASGSTYQISYYIWDAETNRLGVQIYYSNIIVPSYGLIIATNNYRGSNSYFWNTTGIAKGEYRILISVCDGTFTVRKYSSILTISNTNISYPTNDTTPPLTPTGIKLTAGNKIIILQWNKNTEPDFKYYYIYRKSEFEDSFKIIAVIETNYFEDKKVSNMVLYYYKIRAVDINGNTSNFSEEVLGSPSEGIKKESIVWMNDNKITPGENQEITIKFVTGSNQFNIGESYISIEIYNVSMKFVRRYEMYNLVAQKEYKFKWDLKDYNGVPVPTGIYFIYIDGRDFSKIVKVYVIR
jgi:hypothetical protein